jgi:hypothetical protein
MERPEEPWAATASECWEERTVKAKVAYLEDETAPVLEAKRTRGRPRILDERSQRVTVRLHGDEYDALVAFAKGRYWEKSVALRLILREKLLGEKLPF